jgi:two-component system, NtrC family, response regulator GlrR
LQLAAPNERVHARSDGTTSAGDRAVAAEAAFARLVAHSPAMRMVVDRLRRIAQRDSTLLLEGASGTGKGLAAQAVHAASARCERPLLVVDCGAGTAPALAAELLGAATGAGPGDGALSRAQGGTLFLDEVGALPSDLQPRLLSVLEQRELPPAGGGRGRRIDVRILAATNCDLLAQVARGLFRPDLYYRLAVTCVRLPSLNERSEDIPSLCQSLLAELNERDGTSHVLDEATLRRLARRSWPGNVRELRNALERITSLGSEEMEPAPVEPDVPPGGPPGRELPRFHSAKAEVVARFERGYLREMLAQKRGNITAAAAAAGVDRVHFLRLLDRHGLREARPPVPARRRARAASASA